MINMSFIFDNISSQDMGLFIVRIGGSSENSSPFAPAQNIIEEKKYKNHIPAFYRAEKEPLEFEIICSLLDEEFTPEKKMQLSKWLIHEEYKEFISEDNPDLIYNVISTDKIDLITFGSFKGYISIKFRCDAPWGYSSVYQNNFDLSASTLPTTITIYNYSNAVKYLYPEIEFTLSGTDTELTLTNLSNGGEIFEFTDLIIGEKIYTNNERKQIISDLGLYRLSKFNKKWFRFVYGANRIEVTGKCLLSFRYKFPLWA